MASQTGNDSGTLNAFPGELTAAGLAPKQVEKPKNQPPEEWGGQMQLLSSATSDEFSFNQTTDSGNASQKGFNFDSLSPGPNAKFIENTQNAYDNATTDKARDNICGSIRESMATELTTRENHLTQG